MQRKIILAFFLGLALISVANAQQEAVLDDISTEENNTNSTEHPKPDTELAPVEPVVNCPDDKFLYQGSCIDSCPKGYTADNYTRTCVLDLDENEYHIGNNTTNQTEHATNHSNEMNITNITNTTNIANISDESNASKAANATDERRNLADAVTSDIMSNSTNISNLTDAANKTDTTNTTDSSPKFIRRPRILP